MNQSDPIFTIGLKIDLLSFSLPKRIVKDKDEIRVSITTVPDGNKQNFSMQMNDIGYIDHVFEVNITNLTKKIIVVFRKKTLFSKNAIIASTIIHYGDFPKLPQNYDIVDLHSTKTDIKILNIYEPYQQPRKTKHEKHSEFFDEQLQYAEAPDDRKNRKIIGEMQVQFSLTNPFTKVKAAERKKGNTKRNYKENIFENNEQESPNKMFRDLMNNRF